MISKVKYNLTKELIGAGTYGKIVRPNKPFKNMKCSSEYVSKIIIKSEDRTYISSIGSHLLGSKDPQIRELIVLKILKDIPDSDKHVINMIDYNETYTKYNIVFKYIDDKSLYEYISLNTNSIKLRKMLFLNNYQLLESITFLHKNNIVHGDIKSTNVMVDNGNLKIIDFGFSLTRSDIERVFSDKHMRIIHHKLHYEIYIKSGFVRLTNKQLVNFFNNNKKFLYEYFTRGNVFSNLFNDVNYKKYKFKRKFYKSLEEGYFLKILCINSNYDDICYNTDIKNCLVNKIFNNLKTSDFFGYLITLSATTLGMLNCVAQKLNIKYHNYTDYYKLYNNISLFYKTLERNIMYFMDFILYKYTFKNAAIIDDIINSLFEDTLAFVYDIKCDILRVLK